MLINIVQMLREDKELAARHRIADLQRKTSLQRGAMLLRQSVDIDTFEGPDYVISRLKFGSRARRQLTGRREMKVKRNDPLRGPRNFFRVVPFQTVRNAVDRSSSGPLSTRAS
jgi:hypothetical protein